MKTKVERGARYFGKVCERHPELRGERLRSNSHCIRCHRDKIAPTKVRQVMAKQARDKMAAFEYYGATCSRCGISGDMGILTIDHIAQDGAAHRRKIGIKNGQRLYAWLRQNDYPRSFRVLCFNCNIKVYRLHMRGEKE